MLKLIQMEIILIYQMNRIIYMKYLWEWNGNVLNMYVDRYLHRIRWRPEAAHPILLYRMYVWKLCYFAISWFFFSYTREQLSLIVAAQCTCKFLDTEKNFCLTTCVRSCAWLNSRHCKVHAKQSSSKNFCFRYLVHYSTSVEK